MEPVKNSNVVFIFDECHRSQFGDTHQKICQFFTNHQMFGFTGTPVLGIVQPFPVFPQKRIRKLIMLLCWQHVKVALRMSDLSLPRLVSPGWFDLAPFGLSQAEKEQRLTQQLMTLHQHHQTHCPEYGNLFPDDCPSVTHLEELPYIAVRLFKYVTLSSTAPEHVYKTLFSSGTTGQVPAKVIPDQDTSRRQSKFLVKVLQDFIGKQRLPMLIIDHPGVVDSRNSYSARGAGIQGLSFFGRQPEFALNDDMSLNEDVIRQFVQQHGAGPVHLFGFIFMIWKYFIKALAKSDLDVQLPQGFLLHSGGWKKLQAQKVSNAEFKQQCQTLLGLHKIPNFYGMAEQVGSIFVECEEGHLHAPVYADVLVRDPQNFNLLGTGQAGLIRVLSMVPSSYPGNSLLTEDLGKIAGVDDCPCGRKGKYFKVEGRLPKAELRGCRDTSTV